MRNFFSWVLICVGSAMAVYGAVAERNLRDEFPDKTDRRLWIDHTYDMRVYAALTFGGASILVGGILIRK